MQKIFKYKLEVGEQVLQLPQGAGVLSVQNQDGVITMWAVVDPDRPLQPLTITVVGTGWDLPKDIEEYQAMFIGTVQVNGFVWHVFMSNRVD